MNRTILNLKIPRFLTRLHRGKDPALRRRPLAVAQPTARGRIIAPSEDALGEGVTPGMPWVKAKRSCRALVLVPPDPVLYREAQDVLMEELTRFTPLVEAAAWGSFFLDLTGTNLFLGPPADAAVKVRDGVKGAAGFPSRLGIAANKLVSRVAGALTRPLELLSVYPGEEARFLAPLPVSRLPRLGEAASAILEGELGVATLGSLAGLDVRLITSVFGRRGLEISRMARGEDPSPVEPPGARALLTRSCEIPGGEICLEKLLGRLFRLSEGLGRELRAKNRVPGALSLEIVYANGARARGRARSGSADDNLDAALFARASSILARVLKRRIRVRGMALCALDLGLPLPQLSLFPEHGSKTRALSEAVDRIRARFGEKAVFFGRKGIF